MNVLFDRNPTISPPKENLSPLQAQVDAAVGGFVHQATDWRSLAAMTAGGLAYRAGRIGAMGFGSGHLVRMSSAVLGLTAEVLAFELTHRGLSSPRPENPNLWRWSGPGGLAQGFSQSFITFGALKGAGHLSRGQSLVVRHGLQDAAMVAGHRAAGDLGIAPRPHGTLAEQFLHAEGTNLQVLAGMALVHGATPGLSALERGLHLTAADFVPLRSGALLGSGGRSLGVAVLGLACSGCELVGRVEEKAQGADPSDRLLVGVLLATGAVGLYHLYRWWFENRIEAYYHGLRPGESYLDKLRLTQDARLTHYRQVSLGDIRSVMMVANAIFSNATNLEALSRGQVLGAHRVFDLYFDRRSGELKEAYEIMNPQPYYPPPEVEGNDLLHARIGRLIDLNQFADLAAEPILAFSLAQTDGPFRMNDYQIAFRLRELMPRASRKMAMPFEGDLRRLVAGPTHSPAGPISIERESNQYLLRGAQNWEELTEEFSPGYLTRNRSKVSFEGAALRPLDSIQYDDLTFRWIPPRNRNSVEEYAWLRWVPGLTRLRETFMDPKADPADREEAMAAYLEGLKVVPSEARSFLQEERRILAKQWRQESGLSYAETHFYHSAMSAIVKKLFPSHLQKDYFPEEDTEGR